MEIFIDPVREGSIPVIDIQEIIAEVIIGNVNIFPTIVIEVGHRNSKAKAV